MIAVGRLVLLAVIGLGAGAQPVPPARALIDEGMAHASAGRLDDAVQVLREAVALATATGDQGQRGHALRALAQVTSLGGDLPAANALFDEALAAFAEVDDQAAIGTVWNQRGNDAYRRSALDEAERYWLESLNVYRSIDSFRDQASLLRNLTFLSRLSIDQELALLDEALSLSAQSGDRQLEGLIRHQQGDRWYAAGNYASAVAYTEEAVRLLEAADPRSTSLARALTSQGRARRVMGDPSGAYEVNARALALLEAANDFDGAAQAAHAMAVAVRERTPGTLEFISLMDRAVDLARKSRRALTLPTVLGNYAQMIANNAGPSARALDLLAEADRLGPRNARTQRGWALVLSRLGRHTEALEAIDRALVEESSGSAYQRSIVRLDRSRILEQLGRLDEAIDSSHEAIAYIETIRSHLVPLDETRRSYAERWHSALARHVQLLARAGRLNEALVAAERSRARAFVDRLASREEQVGGLRLASHARAAAAPPIAVRGPAWRVSTIDELVGDIRQRIPADPAPPRVPALEAVLAAPPVTLAGIASAAATLRTHLLVYWVGEDETLIWVVAPDGGITTARSAVGESQLGALVRATWASDGLAARAASPGRSLAAASGAGDEVEPAWAPALRGDGTLAFGPSSQRAFRELDRVLVAPVRSALPRGDGALLTIVPHGPLFRLSFAPLLSPASRYLIEEARLTYTPSVATLLRLRAIAPAPAVDRTVVVADPALPADVARRERLARLPGASAEGRAVSRVLGARSTTLLSGPAASESAVRRSLGGARVVHFATHGVVRDDEPMASFLALGGSASSAEDDGRLTSAEVYELSLDADLVVLSACRSARGPVTGDGITGLTRAFFVAGSRSVIASLWDLPDVVTAPLLERFYREWQTSSSKADALRRAQLHVIRELRAGRIAVDTPAGRFVVPEHPSLWAGLVLMGQP